MLFTIKERTFKVNSLCKIVESKEEFWFMCCLCKKVQKPGNSKRYIIIDNVVAKTCLCHDDNDYLFEYYSS